MHSFCYICTLFLEKKSLYRLCDTQPVHNRARFHFICARTNYALKQTGNVVESAEQDVTAHFEGRDLNFISILTFGFSTFAFFQYSTIGSFSLFSQLKKV